MTDSEEIEKDIDDVSTIEIWSVMKYLQNFNVDDKEAKRNIELLIKEFCDLYDDYEQINESNKVLISESKTLHENWKKYINIVAESKGKIEKLTLTNQEWQEKLSSNIVKIKGVLNTFSSLANPDEREHEAKISELKEKVYSQQERIEFLEAKLKKSEQINMSIEQENIELQSQNLELKRCTDLKLKEYIPLSDDRNETTAHHPSAMDQLPQENDTNNAAFYITTLKEKLRIEREKSALLESAVHKFNDERDSIEEENKKLKDENKKLEDTKLQLKVNLTLEKEKFSSYNKQFQEFEKGNNILRTEQAKLVTENTNLKKSKGDLEKNLSFQTARANAFYEKLTQLQEENDNLKDENGRLQKDMLKFKNRITTLEEQNKKLNVDFMFKYRTEQLVKYNDEITGLLLQYREQLVNCLIMHKEIIGRVEHKEFEEKDDAALEKFAETAKLLDKQLATLKQGFVEKAQLSSPASFWENEESSETRSNSL